MPSGKMNNVTQGISRTTTDAIRKGEQHDLGAEGEGGILGGSKGEGKIENKNKQKKQTKKKQQNKKVFLLHEIFPEQHTASAWKADLS